MKEVILSLARGDYDKLARLLIEVEAVERGSGPLIAGVKRLQAEALFDEA